MCQIPIYTWDSHNIYYVCMWIEITPYQTIRAKPSIAQAKSRRGSTIIVIHRGPTLKRTKASPSLDIPATPFGVSKYVRSILTFNSFSLPFNRNGFVCFLLSCLDTFFGNSRVTMCLVPRLMMSDFLDGYINFFGDQEVASLS